MPVPTAAPGPSRHERPVALVTGATRGIGYEVARELAGRGQTVLLGARSAERGEAATAGLRLGGRDVHPIALDVTDPVSAAAAAAEIEGRWGRLDVLVNNAGVSEREAGAEDARRVPSRVPADVVRAVFETNVLGVLVVTNAVLPLLRRSPAARIVNVSSGLASLTLMSDACGSLTAVPFAAIPPSGAYVPSKTALNALTVQYAKELRDVPILVNAADPGPCRTEFNPTGSRTPADGARIVVDLATLGPDGPTGGFFNDDGPVPW